MSWSITFFVLVYLSVQVDSPDVLLRLTALRAYLLFRRTRLSDDPNYSEACSLVTTGNFDSVSNLQLTVDAAELHTAVAKVESVGRVATLIAVNPDANRHDRFGSLLAPLAYAISRHGLI